MAKRLTFKQAAPVASRLYKTGRYKTYADAMRAAMKPGEKTKRVGAIKILQRGETKRTPVKKTLMQKRSTKGRFKGYSNVGDVNSQIGAIKSGSRFIYYKGAHIERKPVEITGKGKRKQKKYVYIAKGKVFNTLKDAKMCVRNK